MLAVKAEVESVAVARAAKTMRAAGEARIVAAEVAAAVKV